MTLPPLRLLYIDDFDVDREFVQKFLARRYEFLQVTALRSSDNLQGYLQTQVFDLVLTEIDFPAGKGWAILDLIKAQNVALPIIIVSNNHLVEVAIQAIKYGAADYVVKTTKQLDRLPEVIQTVLQKQRLQEQQQQLETQLNFYSTLLQNISDSVIMTNLKGRIQYWNKGAEQIFGYSAAEVLGQTLALIYPDYDQELLAQDLKAILAGQDYIGTWQGQRQDGTTVTVDIRTSVMRDSQEKIIGFIGIARLKQ